MYALLLICCCIFAVQIPVKAMEGYLAAMVSPATSPAALAEAQRQFLTYAEALEKDVPEKDVQV